MPSSRLVMSLLLAVSSANLNAAEIDRPLKCAVQKLTHISLATNETDPVSVEDMDPGKTITVLYSINRQTGKLIEIYGAHSDIESVNTYSRGYSAGGTQYIQDDGRAVVTYFGVRGKYHVVVKYIRMIRNDGGLKDGFRSDVYLNAFMYCLVDE